VGIGNEGDRPVASIVGNRAAIRRLVSDPQRPLDAGEGMAVEVTH
jgi:hypothetical protein